jgi:hypothetical protein
MSNITDKRYATHLNTTNTLDGQQLELMSQVEVYLDLLITSSKSVKI